MGATASCKSSRVLVIQSLDDFWAHFENCKKTNKLLVIDFKAGWCGPCKLMKPVFEDLASKNTNVVFIEIDVDELNAVAEKFEVTEMPTFLLIKEGKVIDKVIGANNKELKGAVEKHRT